MRVPASKGRRRPQEHDPRHRPRHSVGRQGNRPRASRGRPDNRQRQIERRASPGRLCDRRVALVAAWRHSVDRRARGRGPWPFLYPTPRLERRPIGVEAVPHERDPAGSAWHASVASQPSPPQPSTHPTTSENNHFRIMHTIRENRRIRGLFRHTRWKWPNGVFDVLDARRPRVRLFRMPRGPTPDDTVPSTGHVTRLASHLRPGNRAFLDRLGRTDGQPSGPVDRAVEAFGIPGSPSFRETRAPSRPQSRLSLRRCLSWPRTPLVRVLPTARQRGCARSPNFTLARITRRRPQSRPLRLVRRPGWLRSRAPRTFRCRLTPGTSSGHAPIRRPASTADRTVPSFRPHRSCAYQTPCRHWPADPFGALQSVSTVPIILPPAVALSLACSRLGLGAETPRNTRRRPLCSLRRLPHEGCWPRHMKGVGHVRERALAESDHGLVCVPQH